MKDLENAVLAIEILSALIQLDPNMDQEEALSDSEVNFIHLY